MSKKEGILVVDDEPNVLYTLGRVLENEGYTVWKASDGKIALQEVEKRKPKVILLDIVMPDMDGFEVLSEIKKKNKDTEVIMLTAVDEIRVAVKAMKEGAFNYITKPFDTEELKVIIEKALKYHEIKIELDRKIIELESLFLITEKFLTEELGIEKVLYMMDDLEAFFQCEIGILVIIEDNKPIIKAGIGIPEKSEKEIIGKQIGLEGVIENIIQKGEVKIKKDFKEDPIYHLLKERDVISGKKEIQSILLIPLNGVDIKGLINIYTTHYHEVLEGNLPFIKQLANHLKVFTHYIEAIRNAKEYGEKLAIAQKEAELGKLASGIVHEMDQLIPSLTVYIEKGKRDEALKDIEHARILLDELRDYIQGSTKEYNFSMVKIRNIIEESLITQHLHRIEKNNITLIEKYDEGIELRLDKNKFQIVINNLLSNAIDAVLSKNPPDKKVTITTLVDTSKKIYHIMVEDNGCGIKEEEKSRMFEPFVSTKPGGFGLGLSITQKIVKRHNGEISFESEYGKGSKFSITLPLE